MIVIETIWPTENDYLLFAFLQTKVQIPGMDSHLGSQLNSSGMFTAPSSVLIFASLFP